MNAPVVLDDRACENSTLSLLKQIIATSLLEPFYSLAGAMPRSLLRMFALLLRNTPQQAAVKIYFSLECESKKR